MNPARSLGPALITGGLPLSQVWLFIVAPLAGAVAGGRGCTSLLYPADPAPGDRVASPDGRHRRAALPGDRAGRLRAGPRPRR